MVKTRRGNYGKPRLEGGNGVKSEESAMETTRDGSMAGMAASGHTAISTKALQEIMADSGKYVSPPRPTDTVTTATTGITYLQTPLTHRLGGLPRFGAPAARYAQSFVNTTAATAGTSTSSAVKAEILASNVNDDDGMVTVSYTRSAMDPNTWEPVRITIDEFRNRYGGTGKTIKKRVSFEGDTKDKPVSVKVRLTPEEEDFIKRVENWAATHKKLRDWEESDEFDNDSWEDRKRFDKTATEKTAKVTETGLATGNYENRLAIVKSLPKLPATEHLMGVDNYDGWNTKMRRFFAAFDVTEYIEKPLAEIRDIDKIKNQLDAAI